MHFSRRRTAGPPKQARDARKEAAESHSPYKARETSFGKVVKQPSVVYNPSHNQIQNKSKLVTEKDLVTDEKNEIKNRTNIFEI